MTKKKNNETAGWLDLIAKTGPAIRATGQQAVTVDKKVLEGTPMIAGTDVKVCDMLVALAVGTDVTFVQREFPSLSEQQIRDVILWVAKSIRLTDME